jgi:hypothetical protein
VKIPGVNPRSGLLVMPMTEPNTPTDVPRDDPPSANEEVAKLRLQLNHLNLEELEEEGLVTWDREKNKVTKGPKFDERNIEEINS